MGDPVAEEFVATTYHGPMGAAAARELLDTALRDGIDTIDDAPPEMRALFEEFEKIPDWVEDDLIERGAACWRRWGYALGSVGNAGTMDTYTEGSLAVPLSLAGGYAGASALNRYLETSRWWLEVCRPGAILTPGSAARDISLKVRVMHVSVRARVARHDEWDSARWGLPISQAEMMLTLLGGSVGPGLGLYSVGFLTSPREIEALLHFNRYLGHLVGVRVDDIYPRTTADGIRLLYLFDATRAHDSGAAGAELVESFVPAFAPQPSMGTVGRVRARYHLAVQAGYTQLFMLPWNRRKYELPSPWPGLSLLLLRAPLTAIGEIARRFSPAIDERLQQGAVHRWQRWHRWQSGRRAEQ
ncbi:oxygenase MpaB family protein [Williamsia sp. 1135]|uniref:oxygenase MpaB family protein n=1 Tax=Williamsia sp. 1135 TaxID=1889262 RepID=UPI0026CDAA42